MSEYLIETEDEEALLDALLGAGPGGFAALSDRACKSILDDIKRHQLRERIWKLECGITARVETELRAAHRRAAFEPKPATKAIYGKSVRRFLRYCQELDVPPVPVDPAVLAGWILNLHDAGIKLKNIQARLSGVASIHRNRGYVAPTKHALVRIVIEHVRKAETQTKEGTNREPQAV